MINKSNMSPKRPTYQSWDYIYADLTNFLLTRAAVPIDARKPDEYIDRMIKIALPALCQRTCELAALVGDTYGDTSASIMVCHENDKEKGILGLRVFSSFPNYDLDRTINTRNGRWDIHLRDTNYKNPNLPSANPDVVSQAILKQVHERKLVNPRTNTPSEDERGIKHIQVILPAQLRTIEDAANLRAGTVVALNIDFYKDGTSGQGDFIFYGPQRMDDLKDIVTEIHEISLLESFEQTKRLAGIKRFLDKIDPEELLNQTLQQLVKSLISNMNIFEN